MVAPSVKSAERVMAILEFFASHQRSASVGKVSRALGYPQSSTSMLLRTLERAGYLSLDKEEAGYRPTLRVLLLGSWMHNELFGEGTLITAIDRLRRKTGHTVLIGVRQGLHVQSVLALRGTRTEAARIPSGVLYPITRSAIGKMLLTLETDSDAERIARSANALEPKARQRVHTPDLVDEIQRCRVHQWSLSENYPFVGHGAIATLLPAVANYPPMGLALGVDMKYLHEHLFELVDDMTEIVRDLFAGRTPTRASREARL